MEVREAKTEEAAEVLAFVLRISDFGFPVFLTHSCPDFGIVEEFPERPKRARCRTRHLASGRVCHPYIRFFPNNRKVRQSTSSKYSLVRLTFFDGEIAMTVRTAVALGAALLLANSTYAQLPYNAPTTPSPFLAGEAMPA